MARLASDVRVVGEGPERPKIMIVGEAPGEVEVKQGRPFAGPAGKVLDGLLREVGINREECYVDNVCQFRPKGNKFEELYDKRKEGAKTVKVPSDVLKSEETRLHNEIAKRDPNIVLALGSHPLRILAPQTCNGGIGNWRGSVINDASGRKIIGTYHPSYLLRQWQDRPIAAFDLAKAKKESETREVKRLERNSYIPDTFKAARYRLEHMLATASRIAFDIEVEGRDHIICIGMAPTPTHTLIIPVTFRGKVYWSPDEWSVLKGLLQQIMESKRIEKIAQNAQYDMIWLKREWDIDVRPLYMDTMIAHSLLMPGFEKSLGFQCSLYTDIPYYKFMGKTMDAGTMYRYNGLDAMATRECADRIEEYLRKENMWDFYNTLPHQLLEPLREMSMRGLAINQPLREEMTHDNKEEQKKLTEAITQDPEIQRFEATHLRRIAKAKIAKRWEASKQKETERDKPRGGSIYGKFPTLGGYITSRAKELPTFNPNSSPQLISYLYGFRKFKPIFAVRADRTRTPTANRDALEKLLSSHQEPILSALIDLHDLVKESEFLCAKLERDGRLHCTYDITGTETGRISSRKYVTDTGANLQNQPAGKRKDSNLRRVFVPDSGKVFMQRDLKQAEAWVVAYLSRDPFFMDAIRSSDVHRRVGSLIFRKPEADITPRERDMAKRCVHALNYGMGWHKFAEIAKLGLIEARGLRNRYFAAFPKLGMWHAEVKQYLMGNRIITTPLGRKREFSGPFGEALWKEAWAYVPQSTVGDLLNIGFLEFWRWLKHDVRGVPFEVEFDTQIMLQIHDSIVVQCPEKHAEYIAGQMKRCLERPLTIHGKTFTIPSDCSIGPNWKDLKEVDW